MEVKRQTAVRARISDLTNFMFIKKEGLESSYVLTDLGMRISKAKLVGTVIDKFISEDGNYSSITLSDDTDTIRVKAFKEDVEIFDELERGDLAMIVGKVKQYADENYLIPQIVRKITDPNVEILHKLDVLKSIKAQKKIFDIINREKDKFADLEELKLFLKKEYLIDPSIAEGVLEFLIQSDKIKETDYKPLIIEKIKELDKGKGVEIAKIIEEVKIPVTLLTELLNELLSDGICYEPNPGVIKLV